MINHDKPGFGRQVTRLVPFLAAKNVVFEWSQWDFIGNFWRDTTNWFRILELFRSIRSLPSFATASQLPQLNPAGNIPRSSPSPSPPRASDRTTAASSHPRTFEICATDRPSRPGRWRLEGYCLASSWCIESTVYGRLKIVDMHPHFIATFRGIWGWTIIKFGTTLSLDKPTSVAQN